MAANKLRNPLNYTGLDYDSIRQQVEYELNQDPRFENFRDSSVAKTILDIFAAAADLNNYYIERRAEEQFLDTARLKSSVIQLTKLLGYSPTRPIPASTGMSIVFNGPLSPSLTAGDTVTFDKFRAYTGADFNFILKDTYVYTFTDDDISNGVNNSDWTKQIDFGVVLSASDAPIPIRNDGGVDSRNLVDIELIQGELKVEEIAGHSENPQVGQKFQKYKIDDKTFSNYYGDQDLGWDASDETDTLSQNITKVGVGQTQAEALDNSEDNLYSIDRRSLINPNLGSPDGSTVPRIVLISSNMNEGVNIYFGDGNFAALGIQNSNQNLYVKYLSTQGATANTVGIIGNEITTLETFFSDNDSVALTDNITFKFKRNITQGTDFEELESMKLNAPALFYSLDRLVTSNDYVSYLKTQLIGDLGNTIKNALAWGEQEEINNRNQLANFRFFNIVFFCVLGELYNFPQAGTYSILGEESIHQAYLENEDDFSSVDETTGVVSADGYPEQSYFNIMVKEELQPELSRVSEYRVNNADHPITKMYDKLDKRSQSTIRHLYITPIVQKMKLTGTVTAGKLEDRIALRKKVNNSIYEWLNDNADFNVKIYKSDIYDLIHDAPEVKFSNIEFDVTRPEQIITSWDTDPDVTNTLTTAMSASIKTILEDEIASYLDNAGYALITSPESSANFAVNNRLDTSAGILSGGTQGVFNHNYSGDANVYRFRDSAEYVAGNINEKTFYQTLMANIYVALGTAIENSDGVVWRDSQQFKNVMYKLHNDIAPAIRAALIDSSGDITNYSLNNEIVQLEIDLTYTLG